MHKLANPKRAAVAAILADDIGRPMAARADFIARMRAAVQHAAPFAAGRLGHSAQYWLLYPHILARAELPRLVREIYERRLLFEACNQSGLFPAEPAYLLQFAEFYTLHLQQMDVIGLTFDNQERERELLRQYTFAADLMDYRDLSPDRSVPADDTRCYLPLFRGKRILLICPFAGLLRTRATRDTFEAVWANIDKRWFYPANVDALEFPYGLEEQTQQRYGTAEALFDEIVTELRQREFDVALIAASGLAVPLASAARQMGKIAVDLGGDLQVLFGVLGKRWRQREHWRRDYLNDGWIDMPAQYRPANPHSADTQDFW